MFLLASAVPRSSSRYKPANLCRSPNARRCVMQYVRIQPARSRLNSLYLYPLCQHLKRRVGGCLDPGHGWYLWHFCNQDQMTRCKRRLQGKSELLVPHASVTGVYSIDWQKLAALGFKGCVLDKDNTLTKPYSMALEPGVQQSLATCSRVFEGNMVLLSNSAGLKGFDRDFSKAATVERALGVPVLRHSSKKPAGGTAGLQERFGCEAHEIVCVGDRGLTDVVFGNLNGLLTIQVDPFDTAPESSAVRWARRRETQLLQEARDAGVQPPPHPLATQEQLREALGRAMRSH